MQHDKFKALEDSMNLALVEREAMVRNALLAILAGEHYLMLGPPGSAKSMLVSALCERITGATKFEWLMGADTTRDELFGPVDVVKWADHGIYERMNAYSVSSAHFVFLDEIYKGGMWILNTLLKVMNERRVYEPNTPKGSPVPLMSLFAASNEIPEDAGLDAFDDRFLFRDLVSYIQDEDALVRMMLAGEDSPEPIIDLGDIAPAQQEAMACKGPKVVFEAILEVRRELSRKDIVISDRRMRAVPKVLKAQAWMEGRQAIEVEDICALIPILWRNPKEKGTVERIVYAHAAPIAAEAIEAEDAASEIAAKAPSEFSVGTASEIENALQQLDHIYTSLEKRAGSHPRAELALAKIGSMMGQIASGYQKYLGSLGMNDRRKAGRS